MFIDSVYQLVHPSLRAVLRNVFERSRKDKLKQFHQQFISPGDLVFDIGANIGDYSECFLEIGAIVVCVEPQPLCVKLLKQRLASNPKVRIVDMGVAAKPGKLTLQVDQKNAATATFSQKFITQGPFSNRNWKETVEVKVTTLDQLIKQYGIPKYCKIDVEGYEYQVLSGLRTVIPNISFEYTTALMEETEKCLDHLAKLGEASFNFSVSYNSTKLLLKEWTADKTVILEAIKKPIFGYSGDIFVKYTSGVSS